MFHPNLKRFKVGEKITAARLNAIMDLVERTARIHVAPPLAMQDTAAGPTIMLGKLFSDIRWGNTGSGFVAATGTPPVLVTSTSVQLYDVIPGNPPSFVNGSTVNAWNPYLHSVASGKVALFGRTIDGTWWVITADC